LRYALSMMDRYAEVPGQRWGGEALKRNLRRLV
jgi:hypothetical protein